MKLARQSLSDQIRDTLIERIRTGALRAGDRVVESRLTKEFQVSTIPVREAIRELVAMRMLCSESHRGAWVRDVSVTETIEAFEVRKVLEGLAAKNATPHLASKCKSLHKLVRELVASARKRDFETFKQLNQRFHRTIVEAAGNGALLRVWDSLDFEVHTKFTMEFLRSEDPVAIAKEHGPIVDAIEAGDATKAGRLLQAHSVHLIAYLKKEAAKLRDSQEVPASAPEHP